MRNRYITAAFILLFAMAACNLPSAQSTQAALTETVIPSAQASLTATTAPPSVTPLPSNTPPPTLTPTPTIPVAFPSDKGVNCRFGPGIEWLVVGALLVGQNATIQGKNGDASWWYVSTPNDPGKPCWVAASVTNTAGNVSNVPVVAAPQASVIDVKIDVEPNTMSVAGCIGPLMPVLITGSIETNGPASVKWHFETQQSGSMASQTTEFKTADVKEFSSDYTPVLAAGNYWVRLVITAPNNDSVETKYKIECP